MQDIKEILFSKQLSNQNLPQLPDNETIKQITKNLKTILFNEYCFFENKQDIDNLFDETVSSIKEEIKLALCYDNYINKESENVCCIDKAAYLTNEFIKKLPTIKDSLMEDVKTTYQHDPAAINHEEIILCYPGLNALISYRIAHELDSLKVPYIPRILSYQAQEKTGIEIHPKAKLANGVMLDHGTGIVIGETCVIGQNVRIYQGVTLGALSVPNRDNLNDQQRHPTIEDDVTIYANTTVLGGKTVIGKGSIIGGNAFITNSIDPYTKVILEKQKYVYKQK